MNHRSLTSQSVVWMNELPASDKSHPFRPGGLVEDPVDVRVADGNPRSLYCHGHVILHRNRPREIKGWGSEGEVKSHRTCHGIELID